MNEGSSNAGAGLDEAKRQTGTEANRHSGKEPRRCKGTEVQTHRGDEHGRTSIVIVVNKGPPLSSSQRSYPPCCPLADLA